MAASNSKKGLSERTLEQTWEINNLGNFFNDKKLIENTNTEILWVEENVVCGRFLVGLLIEEKFIKYYWKLLYKHFVLDNYSLQVELVIHSVIKDGLPNPWHLSKSDAIAEVGKIVCIPERLYRVTDNYDFTQFINFKETWLHEIKLTLKNLPDKNFFAKLKEQELGLVCKNIFVNNMASLVNNQLNSDVKIVTKDKNELFAHKLILCAQCPVFSSMFGSDFLESSTGMVHIDDVSVKTMKILLNYWYTGELLPSWKDDDTVAEFTYAAGKYQMIEILKILDHLLRRDLKKSDGDLDLLRVVHQLSLGNAETRILKIVKHKIKQARGAKELLALFSVTTDNFDEGNFSVSKLLNAADNALSENKFKEACTSEVASQRLLQLLCTTHSYKEACTSDVELMALACKNGHKNVERKLLAHIIDTVSKMDSAEKLFALFDVKYKLTVDVSEALDSLVRENLG